MPHVVGRTFDTDFIWLDLLLTSIWIIILIRRGYIRHLKFGIFGFIAVFIVDFGIWYSLLGTRVFIELPNYLNAFTFLLYFSFTYGMLMFSFAPLMFDKIIEVKEKFLWTLFLFTGWTLISFASQ